MNSQVTQNLFDSENIVSRTLKKNGDYDTKISTKIPLKDKNVVSSSDAALKGKNIIAEKQYCAEQGQVFDDNISFEDGSDEEFFFPEPVPDMCYDIIPHHLVLTKEDIRNLVFGYLKPSGKDESSSTAESFDESFRGMPEPPSWSPDLEFEELELDDDLPPLLPDLD